MGGGRGGGHKFKGNTKQSVSFFCLMVQSRIAIYVYTRKMVPITGRASASFSSMLKLKRIGNE